MPNPNAEANLLLSALSPRERQMFLSKLEDVVLPVKAKLFHAGKVPAFAYFITSGVASVVAHTSEGEDVEVGMIGREGVVGGLQLLGPGSTSTDCFMQLSGGAKRIRFAELQELFHASPEIRALILESVQEQATSLAQIAACNRLHEAEARLCRWLLMASDRIGQDVLNFTQEFLAEMIGTGRPRVTIVAGTLQSSGLIEYTRGRVHILDRSRLEDAACDCYQIVKTSYFGLYHREHADFDTHSLGASAKHS